MTSFTRKLHETSPAAAVAIHRQEYRDYRYGKNVTLAEFTPQAAFGKREHPPTLPAYECWAPELGKPKAIVRASDSFQARKEYARYHQIAVSEVAASRR